MTTFDWLEFGKGKEPEPTGLRPEGPIYEPQDAQGFYDAGRRMRAAGDFESAAHLYGRAVGLDEHHRESWLDRIDSLVRAGNLDEADQRSREALEAYGQIRSFYAARALVLTHRGKRREAMENSDISMDESPTPWRTLCVRGELLLRRQRDSHIDAQWLFEEAAGLAGQDEWEVYLRAGWALMACDLKAKAASHFAEAVHCNPEAAVCWLGLGDTFKALHLYEQAVFYYREAAKASPNNAIAKRRLKDVPLRIFGLMQTFNPKSLQRRWLERTKRR